MDVTETVEKWTESLKFLLRGRFLTQNRPQADLNLFTSSPTFADFFCWNPTKFIQNEKWVLPPKFDDITSRIWLLEEEKKTLLLCFSNHSQTMSHSRKEGVVVKNLHIYVIALTPTSPPFMKTHIATMFCPPPFCYQTTKVLYNVHKHKHKNNVHEHEYFCPWLALF